MKEEGRGNGRQRKKERKGKAWRKENVCLIIDVNVNWNLST